MTQYFESDAVVIDNSTVEGMRFKDLPINQLLVANGSKVIRSTFEGLRTKYGCLGAGVKASEFIDCAFERCDLELDSPGIVTFVGCRFVNVKITGWICLAAEFIDCSFSGRLRKVVFDASLGPLDQEELGRDRNRYENLDFRGCRFRDVAFRGGIELDLARMPEESGGIFLPDATEAFSVALQEAQKHPEHNVERVASAFLKVRLDNALRGQRQDYISPADLRPSSHVETAAYELIRRTLASFDPRY